MTGQKKKINRIKKLHWSGHQSSVYGLEKKEHEMKGFLQFLGVSFIVFQMVTKMEHDTAHHAGGFTVIGKEGTAGSDHKPHPCKWCLF